jgi:hypothetical protein
MPHSTSKCIFLAPAPRMVSDIFDENDLLRLRAVGDVVIHEGGPSQMQSLKTAPRKQKSSSARLTCPHHA